MENEEKRRRLDEMRASVRALEAELARDQSPSAWPPTGYYTTYHVLAGFVLGMIGACTSLLFNVVGSVLVGQHPLQIIRVYLTFPLGEGALRMDNGITLAIGCCLYLGTGMLLGIPIYLVLTRFFDDASFVVRFGVATVLALVIWIVNFYGILSWLQPALFGGRWIVDLVPPWVAALTHLVFGWTLVVVQPLGKYAPYRQMTEKGTL